ncbi:MAG: DUF4038 domain-containing protein [Planctomycetes bacterium]|nr:DUF4038 domain-containing protein [Planctomycetota bacterium]
MRDVSAIVPRRRIRALFSIIAVCVLVVASRVAAQSRTVCLEPDPLGARLYEVFEITLRVESPVALNPFTDVSIDATFTPDDGVPVPAHGFCDSPDGTLFRVRFCPALQRPHRYHLTYRDALGTESFDGSFTVVWSANPGFVRTDPRFPGRFAFERTGETWFHHGCTAYPFMLASDDSARAYVDHMSGDGFNRCRIVLAGGIRYPFTDREMNPFDGADFSRLDTAYWRRLEDRVRYMKEKGMAADVVFLIDWGGFIFQFIQRERITDAEWLLYRTAIDRLAAYTNVTWNLGNEYDSYHSENWANEMGARIKGYDPYRHLLTAHPSGAHFRHGRDAWADMICLQAYAGGTPVTVRTDWNALAESVASALSFGKPVVVDEYGYEVPYPPDVVRKSHWVSVFGGGYATFGSFSGQSVIGTDDRLFGNEVADGQLAHLVDFVRNSPMHLLRPAQGLVIGSEHPAFCRALPGHEYAVYLPDGGKVILDVSDARGVSLPVEWWVPSTGERIRTGETGGASEFGAAPPFAGDALLLVGQTASNGVVSLGFGGMDEGDVLLPGNGDWIERNGALEQLDAGSPATWTWVRGRIYRDVSIDAEVRIDGGSCGRAGILLRAADPAADPRAVETLAVAVDARGRVQLFEVNDGVGTLLESNSAAFWEPNGFNLLRTFIHGNDIAVLVNGWPVIAARTRSSVPTSGFVGLFTEHSLASFALLRVRPILFSDFDDGSSRGVEPLAGNWRVADSHLVQTSARGGIALVTDESYRRMTVDFSLMIDSHAPTEIGGAGVAFRCESQDLGPSSGYLFHYDGEGTVRLSVLEPGEVPRIIGFYRDTPASAALFPGAWNHFDVRADATRFTVWANGRWLFSALDPNDRWPTGYVKLVDLAGRTQFDNLGLSSFD